MRRLAFTVLSVVMSLGIIDACASDEESPPVGDDDANAGDAAVAFDSTATTDAAAADGAEPCSPDGWCYSSFPSGDIADAASVDPNFVPVTLEDVWPMPDHDAWTVSDEGYVLHWTNHAWTFVTDTNLSLRTVWAASKDDVWVAGLGGVVMHGTTTAAGLVFTKLDLGTTDDVIRIRGRSPTDVVAITANSIYAWNGTAFTKLAFPIVSPVSILAINDMWGSADELWIAAHEVSACFQGDVGCDFYDRSVLVHYEGSTSFERIPLDLDCEGRPCNIFRGTRSPTGTFFVYVEGPRLGAPVSGFIAHVTPRDAGVLDAAAAQGDGGYVWALDDPNTNSPPYGIPSTGIWAEADTSAWNIGNAFVRHWKGQSWDVGAVSIGAPLQAALSAVGGTLCTDGSRDMWIVGENSALHRTEMP